jgi:preprotein translocase subunit SecG
MNKTISIIQIIISVALITVILIQNKGVGLSQTFGGSGDGNVFKARRGAEKTIFIITIVLSVTFLGIAFINLFI